MKKNSREIKKTIYYLIIVSGWGVLSLVASQFVTAILMSLILKERFNEPFWMMVYYVLNYTLAMALIFFVLPRIVNLYQRRRQKKLLKSEEVELDQPNDFSANREEMGLKASPTFVDIGLAPVGYIVYIFISNLITKLFSNFAWFDAEETQDVGFSGFVAGNNRIWAILAIVFIAPIAEEIIMRGWFYGKVRKKLPAIGAALLVSVIFGIMHGQWNAGVATFVLSLVLCTMREITGSIWGGILLHILSNGIAFYILYIANAGIL